jgi:predicted aspartyl protease
MCQGYFKGNRPKVDAILYFPKIKEPILIKFLIDTGSDITVLTLTDALKLGVDVHSVIRPNRCKNIESAGGSADIGCGIDQL